MKMLACFDIDGTIANVLHRVNWVQTNPKNWKAFNEAMVNDTPNWPVVRTLQALAKQGTVILASGRGDDYRDVTEKWLADHNIIGWQSLYMRKEGDYRSDEVVKREILDQIIADYGKKPDIWFDDRPRVVKELRRCGVFVADVYQGTVDF